MSSNGDLKIHRDTDKLWKNRYQYSGKDLKVFRFSFVIDRNVVQYLAELNLLRSRIRRRGCRAGTRKSSLVNSTIKQVGRIDNGLGKLKRFRNHNRGINTSNLIIIDSLYNKYSYPNIVYTNCRSIRNKFDEICIMMSSIDPDIAVFAETWLSDNDLNAYDIEGFSALHRLRKRCDKNHGGGVSVYIKSPISIISINYPEMPEVEMLTVLFRTSSMQRSVPFIALIAVYSPPCNTFSDCSIDYIITEIDRIRSINVDADIVIIGDFNDLDVDKRLREPWFSQIINQKTCNDKLIDKCYYSGKIKYNIMTAAPISSSDHRLVILTPENYIKRCVKEGFNYSRPRRNSCFRSMWSTLSITQWSFALDDPCIDTAVESFHSAIVSSYNECFPVVCKKISANNKSWFTKKIENAINKRNFLFNNNKILQYKEKNIEIKAMIREAKKNEYIKFTRMIDDNTLNFYDIVKKYSNIECRNREIVFPNMDTKSSIEWTYSYYNDILNKHSPINAELLPAFLPSLPIKPVTEFFVYNQLKKVKGNGSSAPDGIPNFILREFAFELSPPITKLINRSLMMGYCPKLWKRNFLITIPKKKVISTPSDLRPIVLSSAIVKILERHVFNELLPSLINKIDKKQFGGLPSRSAEHYLTFYLDYVHKNLDRPGNRVTAIVTDYTKAFDAIDHNMFMFRLLSMGAPPGLCKWILSFLENRMLILKWNNCLTSSFIQCSNGAPQGSVLGGLIFSITINEVASGYESRLKYVDDLTVLCLQSDKEDGTVPQQMVESLYRESGEAKMSLNISKCQFMVHCFSKNPSAIELNLDSASLSRTNQCKIIGVIIQENLKWDSQIDSIVANANKKIFLLYRLKNVGMCPSLLTKTYYTYIRPCMEYCCVIWSTSITRAQILDLERIQKRVVRLILGNNYISYEDALFQLNLESLEDRRTSLFKKYAIKFFSLYPETRPDTRYGLSGRDTRASAKLCVPKCHTKRYMNSPIPKMIQAYNSIV